MSFTSSLRGRFARNCYPTSQMENWDREVYSDFPKATELSGKRARIWIRVFGPHNCLHTSCTSGSFLIVGYWCHVVLILGKTGSRQFPHALSHEPGGHHRFPFVIINPWTHIEAECLKARIDLNVIPNFILFFRCNLCCSVLSPSECLSFKIFPSWVNTDLGGQSLFSIALSLWEFYLLTSIYSFFKTFPVIKKK